MIIAAAIKFGDVICFVPSPGRHHNVLQGLHDNHSKRTKGYDSEVQGFITHTGVFLDRREAFKHVKEWGQKMQRREGPGYYDGDELYSEDLW
jgi:hypothetical protein